MACKGDNHSLSECKLFQNLSGEGRWALIRENGYCVNCLKAGHIARWCQVRPKCRKCGKRHHALLHFEERSELKYNDKEQEIATKARTPEV